jgi:hypothetical protein
VNVKRAVATAAGVFGALLLAAVVGLGHFAGHSSGAGTQAQAAVVHTVPVKASLTALIYGDSVDAPATTSTASASTASSSTSSSTPSYVDDSSSYTSTYGSDGSTTPASGDGTSDIYGDGSSDIYGDGGNIYGDSSPSTANYIYGD